MARRGGRIWRCPDGKIAFSGYRLATQALYRLSEPGYVYWCQRGGCYHVTRYTPAEYSRRQAEYRATGAVA